MKLCPWRVGFAVMLALALIGCGEGDIPAGPNKKNYDRVTPGMVLEDVHKLLGKPTDREQFVYSGGSGPEIWKTDDGHTIEITYVVGFDKTKREVSSKNYR